MSIRNVFRVISTVFLLIGLLLGSTVIQANENTSNSIETEDPVAAEGRSYAHKKYQGQITPYLLINTFEYNSRKARYGAGFTAALWSSDLFLFDAGVAYWPTGFKTSQGQTFGEYLALPLSFKFFLEKRDVLNVGPYIHAGLVQKFLLDADRFESKFHDSATLARLGVGAVIPSQMKNAIVLELAWATNLTPIMKSEDVDSKSMIFSAGLTL